MRADEKQCPYCAEVIKAAAVKCRYCHSDLPPSEEQLVESTESEAVPTTGEPEADEPTVDEPTSDQPTSDEPVHAARLSALLADKVVAGLLVLCLLLAGGLGYILVTSPDDDLATADNGQVTAAPYRSQTMSAAAANVRTILSYGYKTLEEDEKSARAVLTPAYFEKEYQATLAKRRASITKSKLTQTATVLSTSLVSLSRGRARVMLLTNIVNIPEGAKTDPPQTLSRLLVTMERKHGEWVVSQMVGF